MTAMNTAGNSFRSFSKKQMKVLNWWTPSSPDRDRDGIICDGAVRSGKTLCMTVSFISWAMCGFSGAQFAICGKTISSVRRNITTPVFPVLRSLGFSIKESVSRNEFEVTAFGHRNKFSVFGGRDESSASLIQGMTLGGVMLDEVALMPRSFTDQALARCSAEGAKFWFNCNPEHPMHWFREEWINRAEEKNMLYIHFVMSDNPSLSPAVLARYERLYTGVFRERYILGKWVAARGCVYPMFSRENNVSQPPGECSRFMISCDYGTVNPSSFGLWGYCSGVWYRLGEYYYDSRITGVRRTDGEHYEALCALARGRNIECVIVDPSAASFIEYIRREGKFTVISADNDVIGGIRRVQDALRSGKIAICPSCRDTIREFGLYRWNEKSADDSVIKENDHAMDDIRYFVSAVFSAKAESGFFAMSVDRK